MSNVLAMSVVAMSLSFSIGSVKNLSLDLGRVLHGEVYRLFSSHLYFKTWPQLIIGLFLFRNISVFEKFMGSRKFGNFMFLSWGMTTLSQVAFVATASSIGISLAPEPGPFFYIFSLIPFYYKHVPKVSKTHYKVLTIPLSEKTWVYALSLQLAFSDDLRSIVSAISGILAGYLYMSDDMNLQNFRLPSVIEKICGTVGALLDSLFSNVTTGNSPRPRHQDRGREPMIDPMVAQRLMQQQDGGFGHLVEPSEANIETLMGLGFDRELCVNALRNTNNNVEAAADRLLSGAQ